MPCSLVGVSIRNDRVTICQIPWQEWEWNIQERSQSRCLTGQCGVEGFPPTSYHEGAKGPGPGPGSDEGNCSSMVTSTKSFDRVMMAFCWVVPGGFVGDGSSHLQGQTFLAHLPRPLPEPCSEMSKASIDAQGGPLVGFPSITWKPPRVLSKSLRFRSGCWWFPVEPYSTADGSFWGVQLGGRDFRVFLACRWIIEFYQLPINCLLNSRWAFA